MKTTKPILFPLLSVVPTCVLVLVSYAALSTNSSASEKPAIAVPSFQNKTGDPVTRKSSSDYIDIIEIERHGDQIRGKQVTSNNGTLDAPQQSGLRLPDVATEVATNAVKEALARCGKFRVVDYSPLVEYEINEKRKKEQSNGYVIANTDSVDYLLVGSINNYRVQNEKSVVYGVKRWRNTVTVSLDVRLIHASSQEVIASKTMSEKLSRDIPEGVEIDGLNDDWEEPLRKAISAAVPKFITSINIASDSGDVSNVAEPVTFEVKSTPDGADVEYNDSFVGNTPCSVTAPASPGILRISMAGYKTWEKKLTPSENMRICPILQKVGNSGNTKTKNSNNSSAH